MPAELGGERRRERDAGVSVVPAARRGGQHLVVQAAVVGEGRDERPVAAREEAFTGGEHAYADLRDAGDRGSSRGVEP